MSNGSTPPWAEMAAFRWYLCAIEEAVIEAYMTEDPKIKYSDIRDALQHALDSVRRLHRLATAEQVTKCMYPFCLKDDRCVPCEETGVPEAS